MTDTTRKYHPWNAKAQSWEFIENRYLTDWKEQYLRLAADILDVTAISLEKNKQLME